MYRQRLSKNEYYRGNMQLKNAKLAEITGG